MRGYQEDLMDGPNDSRMGDRLRAARERLGWSREELAFRSGVSWSAIAQAETGRRRNLRPRTLFLLSMPLGVSIDYLVAGGPTRPMLDHQALLYDTEQAFTEGAGRFLLEGIERSEATLVVTNKGNIEILRDELGREAEQVELVDSANALTSPEAALELFTGFLNDKIQQGAVWTRVLAEPIWAGRSKSEVRLWTRFESLINLLLGSSPASVVCPYNVKALPPAILREAHATHPRMAEGGAVTVSPDYRGPGSFALDA
jgi:transcriptional regulator with XRE-family HTH domain